MDPVNPSRPSWEDDTQAVPPLPQAPSGPVAGEDPEPAWPPSGPSGAPPATTPPTPPPARPSMPAARPPGAPGAPQIRRDPDRVGTLVLGILLVLFGAAFLVSRFVDLSFGGETWPLWIIAVGGAMLLASLAIRNQAGLGLAVPGGIVLMVGIVLFVQERYDLYQTWAYAWALVAPGGVGLGMVLHGLFTGDAETRGNGLQTLLVGLGLFTGFGLFFEGVVGLSGSRIPGLDDALPVIVIVLGAVMVAASLLGSGRRRA